MRKFLILATILVWAGLCGSASAQTTTHTDCTINGNTADCNSQTKPAPIPEDQIVRGWGAKLAANRKKLAEANAIKAEQKKAVDWCAANPGHEHGWTFPNGQQVTCDGGKPTPVSAGH